MAVKKGFKLTSGDVEILTCVYQCRLVRIDHLEKLTGRSTRPLNTRLMKLTENGYLYRRKGELHEKYVYTLNRKAVPILSESGVAPAESIDLHVRRLRDLKELFLRHALMLTDIHIALILASRESSIQLVDWREGKELYDSITILEDGERKKLPVRPDSIFVLEDTRRPAGKNQLCFFLEADRSTTTNKRFQRKIKGYRAYFEQGVHTKKYGITAARVLTVTLTEARAFNLCKTSGDVLLANISKFYYFGVVSSITPECIFDAILITPHDFEKGKRYSLIPPLAK